MRNLRRNFQVTKHSKFPDCFHDGNFLSRGRDTMQWPPINRRSVKMCESVTVEKHQREGVAQN